MLQEDYLLRMLLQLIMGIQKVLHKKDDDPEVSAASLEQMLANATDMDPDVLFSLAPESFGDILWVSGTDPKVVGTLVHGMYLEAYYLDQAGDHELADIRRAQADSLAAAYDMESPDPETIGTDEALEALDGYEEAMAQAE